MDCQPCTSAQKRCDPSCGKDCWDDLSKEERVQRVKIWLETVEQAFNRTPIIYTNRYFWEDKFGPVPEFVRYALWIADYSSSSRQQEKPVVYVNLADNSINPKTRYTALLTLPYAGASPWYHPSCATHSGSLRWGRSSSCSPGCGRTPPRPVVSRSHPPSPPDASDPIHPHGLQDCPRSPLAPCVRTTPRLLTRRLRRHPIRCPRPLDAPAGSRPPGPAVPIRAVAFAAGSGWAPCAPLGIPVAAPGDHARVPRARAPVPSIMARSVMARGSPGS
jgi:hypothetical protein